jgi:hypothetical protein
MNKLIGFGSLDSVELRERDRRLEELAAYSYKGPWDEASVDDVKNFDRTVQALEYKLRAPWDVSQVLSPHEQTERLSSYKYKSLWDQPAKKKETINYQYNPPYDSEVSVRPSSARNAKKSVPDLVPTIPPWQQ